MPRKPPDPSVAVIADIVCKSSSRSALYVWLKRNHDAFAAMLQEHRPNWAALAEGFAKQGLTNGPIKPETARHIWYRARKDTLAARRARLGNAPKVTLLRPPLSPAPAVVAEQHDDPLAAIRNAVNLRSGR